MTRRAVACSDAGQHRGACEQDDRQRHGGERGVQRRGEVGGGELDHVAVGEPLLAADRDGPAAQLAHPRAQASLRDAQREATRGDEDAGGTNGERVGPVARERGERPPRGGEPDVGMEAPPEQLEVVCHDDERPGGDQRRELHRDHDQAGQSDRDRAHEPNGGQRDERAVGEPCCQWSAVQLVQRVRAHPNPEEKRSERRRETVPVQHGSGGRTQGDIAQVPGRVRRVQERDDVAPATRSQRVERRALKLRGGHRHEPPTSPRRRRGSCAGRGRRRCRRPARARAGARADSVRRRR